jgi:hypothetical protein
MIYVHDLVPEIFKMTIFHCSDQTINDQLANDYETIHPDQTHGSPDGELWMSSGYSGLPWL